MFTVVVLYLERPWKGIWFSCIGFLCWQEALQASSQSKNSATLRNCMANDSTFYILSAI